MTGRRYWICSRMTYMMARTATSTESSISPETYGLYDWLVRFCIFKQSLGVEMGPYSYSKHIGTQGAILGLVCCSLLCGHRSGPTAGRKGSTRHNSHSWK